MKTCTLCKLELPLESFWKRDGGRRRSRCRDCHHSGRPKRQPKQTREEKLEAKRDYHLRKRYGVDADWYEEQLVRQGGVCASCGGPPGARRLHVDHCHETGMVRELLCSRCNTVLGHLEDTEFIDKLYEYRDRHRVNGATSRAS